MIIGFFQFLISSLIYLTRKLTQDRVNPIRFYIVLFSSAFARGILFDLLFDQKINFDAFKIYILIFILFHSFFKFILKYSLADIDEFKSNTIRRNILYLLYNIGDALKLSHFIGLYIKNNDQPNYMLLGIVILWGNFSFITLIFE